MIELLEMRLTNAKMLFRKEIFMAEYFTIYKLRELCALYKADLLKMNDLDALRVSGKDTHDRRLVFVI